MTTAAEAMEAVGTIVNVSKTAWDVIKENQPVVDVDADYANAIPSVEDWWSNMDGGRGPSWESFAYIVENAYGITTVDARFRLAWTHSARYKGGGAFIPNATLWVDGLYVAWGYTLNVSVDVGNPEPRGDREAPVAYLPVTVNITSSTYVTTVSKSYPFALLGTGTAEKYSAD
jgi:hypothetical protein